MIFDTNQTKVKIRAEFEKVLDFVTGEQARTATADQIERGLFTRLYPFVFDPHIWVEIAARTYMQGVNIAKMAQNRPKSVKIGPKTPKWIKSSYDAFLEKCERLRSQGHAIIFCGDVNTAHQEIDLAHPKANQKTTGFCQKNGPGSIKS